MEGHVLVGVVQQSAKRLLADFTLCISVANHQVIYLPIQCTRVQSEDYLQLGLISSRQK